MNRKLLSLVLAAVFTVSLGVSGWAYSYEDQASAAFASVLGETGQKRIIQIGSPDDLLGGNLTAVFKYYAGTLIGYEGAGGNFQVYDSYGARGSMNNAGGIWSVTGWNMRSSDIAEIEAAGSFEAYFMSVGFTESQLSVALTDEDGNLLDASGNKIENAEGMANVVKQKVSTELYQKLLDTLKSGTNYQVSMSIGSGVTGPSITISENGKTMSTWTTNANTGGITWTQLYQYDDKGYMTGVFTHTQEAVAATDGEGNGNNGSMILEDRFNYTKITYDGTGIRTDTTYKFFNMPSDGNLFAYADSVLSGSHVAGVGATVDASTQAQITYVTNYSPNGSIISSVDYTTNQTTYYSNGRPSYVVNAEGSTVTSYGYTENGVISYVWSRVADDSSGQNGTITLFDEWGRQRFTATVGSDYNPAQDDRIMASLWDEFNNGLRNGFSEDTRISNITLYADDLLNANAPRTSNGFIDLSRVNSSHYNTNLKGLLFKNDAQFNAAINNALNFFTSGTTAVLSISIAPINVSGDAAKEYLTGDQAGNTTIISSTLTTTTNRTTRGGNERRGATVSDNTTSETTLHGMAYNTTVLIGGASAYSVTHNVIHQETVATRSMVISSDPAITGQMWSPKNEQELLDMANKLGIDPTDEAAMKNLRNGFYTDASGQTYAIVAADSVNIMDGNGFQAAKGETIMVAIDTKTKNTIEKNITKGDRNVMFMGDVRESVGGYLTMTMNTSYSGGFVTGSAAIEAMKTEITQKSQTVAMARDALELGEITQAEYNSIVESAGWVGNNTAENLDKFAKGNFSWDNDKTAAQNLRDAWEILLNF